MGGREGGSEELNIECSVCHVTGSITDVQDDSNI